jgi:CheY-like chemotaxis protein
VADAVRSGGEGAPLRVLVVEDDPGVSAMIVETLAQWRAIECGTATSFEEAAAALSAREYRALVVDSRLQSGTGADVYRHLRETGSPLQGRIVFITGWLEDPELEEICRLSGNAFIRKPFVQAEFLPSLERALGVGREAWLGPAMK